MRSSKRTGAQRVAVVTGGATGIGRAIAEELGRSGVFVLIVDPTVSVDGSTRIATSEPTTAQRIVEAGGLARTSSTSVTDRDSVRTVFDELFAEFGSIDAVVNAAGVTRPTGFATGTEDDWATVLSVHLDGYLNILGAALPIMSETGHGRILGVTSGSGWRVANAGAYSCAKRAVAGLTWQLGQNLPQGVTVNALSPIAATRMVTTSISRRGQADPKPAEASAAGGLSLQSLPPPQNLGSVGAYLVSDEFSWCRGQVIFSGGSELTWVTPPHLLEAARSAEVTSLSHALETLVPVAFTPAEVAQVTSGGGNPRFGAIFAEAAVGPDHGPLERRSCMVVTDDSAWGVVISEALQRRGVSCVGIGAWPGARPGPTEIAAGFAGAATQIANASQAVGPIDAVVVALVNGRGALSEGTSRSGRWQQILDEHIGLTDSIRTDAAWVRAVSDYSADNDRPVQVVTVTNATTAGGRSRGQAIAQLARTAHMATSGRVDAFPISVETADESERRPIATLIAHLVCASDTAPLSGAELVAGTGWFGLRSHPRPAGTISFGGPAVPTWVNGALRHMVTG